jgi:hypothetical protein
MESRTPLSPRPVWWATALCFFLPLFLYALTAARTVQGGDAGEFGVVAALGGVAHPPGYPIYVWLGRLATHLPFGPLYWRIALASAACGAAASAVLFRVCLRLTGALAPSILSSLAFALGPIAWRLAGVPEVFSLHALACATTLLCSLRLAEAAPGKLARESAVLGLTLGLGMANHQTLVLLAPIVLFALLSAWRRTTLAELAKASVVLAGAALIGLAPYLLLVHDARMAPAQTLIWGHTDNLEGLLTHVLRREYGTFQLASGSGVETPDPGRSILHFLTSLPRSYAYGFFLAGIAGVVSGARSRRGLTLSLLGSLILCLLFLSIFNLTDTPTHREIVERFHLMPTLLFAPFVAWGLAELGARGTSPALITGLSAAMLTGSAAAAWRSVDWAGDSAIEQMTIAEVEAAAPHAIILGRGDTDGAAMIWVTQVLHHRSDVLYLDVNLLTRSWYFTRASRRLAPIPLPLPRNAAHVGELANELLPFAPTYVIPSLSIDAAATASLEPAGFLDGVVPAGAQPLPLDEVEARLRRATLALGPLPPPVDAWSEEMHIAAGYRWLVLAEALRKQGQSQRATACSTDAQALLPPGWNE